MRHPRLLVAVVAATALLAPPAALAKPAQQRFVTAVPGTAPGATIPGVAPPSGVPDRHR